MSHHFSRRTIKYFFAALVIVGILPYIFVFSGRKHPLIDVTENSQDKAATDLEFQILHFKSKNTDRVRKIYKAGKRNRLADLQMYVVPQVSCPTMVRVGALGDGGKWVCNPWRVPSGCVVYSLGVHGDVSFEEDMYNITDHRCKFYCVDMGTLSGQLFEPFNGVFIQSIIAGQTDPKSGKISIIDLMRRYDHTRIDILKMDTESSEFESLDGFFKEANISESQSNVCQLLVKFHFTNGRLETWTEMFYQIDRSGFRMFAKEANMYYADRHEYSFIHQTCFDNFGLANDSVFDNIGLITQLDAWLSFFWIL